MPNEVTGALGSLPAVFLGGWFACAKIESLHVRCQVGRLELALPTAFDLALVTGFVEAELFVAGKTGLAKSDYEKVRQKNLDILQATRRR